MRRARPTASSRTPPPVRARRVATTASSSCRPTPPCANPTPPPGRAPRGGNAGFFVVPPDADFPPGKPLQATLKGGNGQLRYQDPPEVPPPPPPPVIVLLRRLANPHLQEQSD